MTEPAKEPAIVNIDGKELRVPEDFTLTAVRALREGAMNPEYKKDLVCRAFTYWMLKAMAKQYESSMEGNGEPILEVLDEFGFALNWADWGKLGEGE